MLILLAPSEGKTAPVFGAPVDLAGLVHADVLTPARGRALAALIGLSASTQRGRALKSLGLSKGQAGDLDSNAALADAPTGPAAEVYTGVLYQHLALAELGSRARSRAADSVLVASALWGVVGLEDHIPAYRLSMVATLRSLRKGLPAFWRKPLGAALPDAEDELVLDLRSGAYATAWKPSHSTVVQIRAVTPQGTVVSHMAKATRGRVARAAIQASTPPREPAAVAALAGEGAVLHEPQSRGAPWIIEVVSG